MKLKEGKNIERMLAGTVNNPISKEEYMRKVVAAGGLEAYRQQLMRTLNQEMEEVRKDQTDSKPWNPKAYFAKNLLADIDLELEDITEIDKGEHYELRFYSSVDTVLDYGGGFDCWVELFDKKKKKSLGHFLIDLTINPNKIMPEYLEDTIFHFDYLDEDAKGKIDPAMFDHIDYKTLVKKAAKVLKQRVKINSVFK